MSWSNEERRTESTVSCDIGSFGCANGIPVRYNASRTAYSGGITAEPKTWTLNKNHGTQETVA